ncbi:Thiosulfate sulfurtransferase GlpE [Saliniradius amylolyticus]|uniref:Thiosulfate sulfurtransferase GlpE n=1 Tax=Saliniradius amylolyticus TaxID=2183582 RepID=A0A2S2E4M8_9ALTE|nr:rhodanese-like domain-containing protein [Saliniradius amylolyticus]AWL12472.1 Thiosulfate sulfurtransferase GlpE [Saliniradius amylolyticus]
MIKSAPEIVADVKKHINEVPVTTLEQQLAHDVMIIDVREPGEYEQGFVPGAVNLPRGVLEMKIASLAEGAEAPLDELAQKDIYLYCRSGARSALAAESLQRMGFNKVYSVDGGFEAWKKAELKVEHP